MAFVGGFVIVRILSKEDYGIYTYVLNVYSILSILGDFGISAAALQYASVNYDDAIKKRSYIRYGFRCLHRVSVFSILIIGILSFMYPFTIEGAGKFFRILIILPFFNNEIVYYQSILRVELKNKQYARINIISSFLHYTSLISLAVLLGVKGAIMASYPEAIIVLIIYIFSTAPQNNVCEEIGLSRSEKVSFFKFGLLMQVNQISLALLNYLDIYCLGITVKDPKTIAEYKVASAIPTAMNFIPKSIMFFMVPIMGRYKNNLQKTMISFKKILVSSFALCFFIAAAFGLTSHFIIRVIYGEQYLSSVPSYLVLLVGFVVYGILQSPASNILSVQEKLNVILVTSILGAILNIFMNILLINAIGSIGIAISTVTSHLFIGCVCTIYLMSYLKKSKK